MKLSQILITEIFDKPVPIKWDTVNNKEWSGRFNINDKIYNIRMIKIQEMPWEVVFSLIQNNKSIQSITGTGNASTVFATVLYGIKKWLKKVEPPEFVISAAEPSRQKLYKRMLQMLPPQWDVEDLGMTFYVRDTTQQDVTHAGYGDEFEDYYDD